MKCTELSITELGPLGDGIHKSKRGTVFVERTIPGDQILALVKRDRAGTLRGKVTEFTKTSLHRSEPPCPYFENCGNCSLQHLKASYYREWKSQTAAQLFMNEGISPEKWLDPVFLEGAIRRRLTFSALRIGDRMALGYYRRRSNQIIDLDVCWVSDPLLFGVRDRLKGILPSILKHGGTVDFFLQRVGESIDLVLTGEIGKKGYPDFEVKRALEPLLVLSAIKRITWRRTTASAMKIIAGTERMTYSFGSLCVELPPAAFLQPTTQGESVLVDAVKEALPKKGYFADLFSGCGTFTGSLLELGSVDAFEREASSVLALGKAAGNRSLKAQRRDLFKNPLRSTELNSYDAIVFDPPRAGCERQAIEMAKSKVPLLIGVSCNPMTFARDAKILCRGGYKLKTLQIIDQFQWSHHMEMVGVFCKG